MPGAEIGSDGDHGYLAVDSSAEDEAVPEKWVEIEEDKISYCIPHDRPSPKESGQRSVCLV